MRKGRRSSKRERRERGRRSSQKEREGGRGDALDWGMICNLPKNTPMGDEL